MELDARELQDLAGFFGRRFPDHLAGQLANASGVPLGPSAGWATLVTEAARLDRLPQLAEAAKRARPGDPNVEELGRILVRPRRASKVAMGLVGLGLVGLGLVALVGALALRGSDGTVETPPVVDVSLVSAVSPVAAPSASAAVIAPVAAPEALPPVEPSPAAQPEVAAAVVAPVVSTSAAAGACRGTAGEVIGYFHAGSVAPGQKGETVTLGRGARVRADYPDRHNHFNATAAVRCVLPPGARLRLDAEPIAVPGSAVWVPVVGGSVL